MHNQYYPNYQVDKHSKKNSLERNEDQCCLCFPVSLRSKQMQLEVCRKNYMQYIFQSVLMLFPLY